MKTYHIYYPRDFANEYILCYCETEKERSEAKAAGLVRILRKDAETKCRNERWARQHDQAFSGFGSATIEGWNLIREVF